jgi:hypothetical protein
MKTNKKKAKNFTGVVKGLGVRPSISPRYSEIAIITNPNPRK